MSNIPIQIVDEHDQPVGQASKEEVWGKGLLHRIVRIMITNPAGELLLQHRDASKKIFPSCWDNSAAGHVDAGEDYDTAAYRELKEELGLHDVPLTVRGDYRSDETIDGKRFNRFTRCDTATIQATPHSLGAGEVTDVRWVTIAEAKKLVQEHPDQVTDGLRQVMEHYY